MKKKHHLNNLPQGKREVMMAAINARTSVDHDTLLPGGGGGMSMSDGKITGRALDWQGWSVGHPASFAILL